MIPSSDRRPRRDGPRSLALLLATVLLAVPASGQLPISVSLDTGGEEWVARDANVALVLDRWPESTEGRLAIVVGSSDRSDLFRRAGERLVYRPELLPLPAGETQIVVYLVAPSDPWSEIARMPLRVLRAGGIETLTTGGSLDLELRGFHEPAAAPELEDETRGELSGQGNLALSATRQGWSYDLAVGIVGASEQEQALRFGTDGPGAPRVDLASYLFTARRGRGLFELGHVTFGQSRHLVSGFLSRGVHLLLPLGSRAEVSLAALNGTQIAGYDNFFGLSENEHRVYAGTLSVELLSRPGALKLSGSVLDARILPRSDFNQFFLEDREESSGWSAQVEASTPGQRLRFRGGWARSDYDNPDDPLLSQGAELVPVDEESRDAYYAEVETDLLRNPTPGVGWGTSLGVALRYSRIDPLYGTPGAFLTPDLEEGIAELNASVGPFVAQGSYRRAEDNLDEVASILKTLTRDTQASLMLPLGQAWARDDGTPRPALPMVSYRLGHNHQFGDSLPVGGGFDPSHVPDQVNLVQETALEWQGNGWRFAYRLGLSDQDNRQPGRERDDFEGVVHGLSAQLAPHPRLDLSLDFSDESNENLALGETELTRRYGLNLDWRWTDRMTFGVIGSRSEGENDPKTRESTADQLDAQWSWRFDLSRGAHGLSGQLHLLYSRQEMTSVDTVFGFSDQLSTWRLSSGLSLSIH